MKRNYFIISFLNPIYKPNKINKWEFLIYILIIIIPLIISLIAYYPGFFVPDSLNQLEQAQSNIYNNWHPVMNTLIFFKLPILFYNHAVSVTIFQELFILVIMVYLAYFLRKNFLSIKGTILALLLMVLNPLFMKYSIFVVKDVPYSFCILLVTLFLINIVISTNW